jgi:hypothetical protein
MSLVNDALRRAQDAQKKSQPAAPGPALRPADPAPAQKRGIGIWIAAFTAFAAVMALSVLWRGWQETNPVHAAIQPKTAAPAAVVPETKPPVQQVAALAQAPATPAPASAKPAPAPAVSAPIPVLKLQAIFFAPGHSSAIISGKTVHAGDNFKGFRVAAITQTSATLVSATQTNVMTLEPD